MIIGFSGTRFGMSIQQKNWLIAKFQEIQRSNTRIEQFHHGDCVGADAEAHEIAKTLRIPIHRHPPTDHTYQAYTQGWDFTWDPFPYLTRNRHIVNECDTIIAMPRHLNDGFKGGTWYTARYAKSQCKIVWVVSPGGHMQAGHEIRGL